MTPRGKTLASPESGQLDHEAALDYARAGALDEPDGRFGGAAGGDQVIGDEHVLTSGERVRVHFTR